MLSNNLSYVMLDKHGTPPDVGDMIIYQCGENLYKQITVVVRNVRLVLPYKGDYHAQIHCVHLN
jgi:hypothetical protein